MPRISSKGCVPGRMRWETRTRLTSQAQTPTKVMPTSSLGVLVFLLGVAPGV